LLAAWLESAPSREAISQKCAKSAKSPYITDIEDRKRADKALRASEQEARELLERVPAMIPLRTVEGASFASERVRG
jgi:PAS domain-containing protein